LGTCLYRGTSASPISRDDREDTGPGEPPGRPVTVHTLRIQPERQAPWPGHLRHSTADQQPGNREPAEELLPLVRFRPPGRDERRAFLVHAFFFGSSGPVLRPMPAARLTARRVDHVNGRTGEPVHRYTTVHEPGGVLKVACKTRRASRCPPCAEVYQADTYQLIRAGPSGGKGVPATVTRHPCVFLTLTAPRTGCSPSAAWPPTPEPAEASCSTCAGQHPSPAPRPLECQPHGIAPHRRTVASDEYSVLPCPAHQVLSQNRQHVGGMTTVRLQRQSWDLHATGRSLARSEPAPGSWHGFLTIAPSRTAVLSTARRNL
jgi:hypothetical protein